jgi:hypothetical protein
MSLAFDPANWRQAAIERRRRLYNPPNAKHDPGINIKNGRPVIVEPPAPTPKPTPEPKPQASLPNRVYSDDEYVAEFFTEKQERVATPVSVEAIQKAICKRYGITRNDLLSQRRTWNVVIPRHVGIYLSRELTPLSLPRIAALFGGKDHTTAMNSVRRTLELMANDPKVKEAVDELMERFSK